MKIKEIGLVAINNHLDDDTKRKNILKLIAEDQNAINDILETLQYERIFKQELLSEMNVELSRAHVYIDDLSPELLSKKEKETLTLPSQVTKNMVMDKISEFYIKYKGVIRHSFNRFNEDKN